MRLDANLNLDRYAWARECLVELSKHSAAQLVSDIGAGDGRMKQVATDLGLGWQGFDLFPKNAEIQPWDLDCPAPAQSRLANCALFLDVLEHLRNPWLALSNVQRHLAPNATLILTTPNPLWSRSRWIALATGLPACFSRSDLELNHHVFTPWPHIVEKLLRDCGFRVTRYVTLDGHTRWPGRPFGLRYPVRLLFAGLNALVERRDGSACGMSYGLLALKES